MLALELANVLVDSQPYLGKDGQPPILSIAQRRVTASGESWSQNAEGGFEYTHSLQVTKGSQQLVYLVPHTAYGILSLITG